jgi:AraC-like DNA-binding protein
MECQHEDHDAFHTLVAERAREPGRCDLVFPGVHFYRATSPVRIRYSIGFSAFVSVVAQGRKVVRLGGLELAYAPCHYLVVTGGEEIEGEIFEASPEAPYLSITVELPSDVIAKTLLALADADATIAAASAEAPVAFVAPVDRSIKDTVTRYVRACEDPLEQRLVAPHVLEELVFRLLRTDSAAVLRGAVGREPHAGAIQRAIRFMREHATETVSVEDVARHVGMSASHFAHRFSAIARTSPMRYLKQLRLHEARALMLADSLRVAEVAARVGYESASHFTRDFKSHFGATPGDYLRQFRAGSGERTAAPDIVEPAPAN